MYTLVLLGLIGAVVGTTLVIIYERSLATVDGRGRRQYHISKGALVGSISLGAFIGAVVGAVIAIPISILIGFLFPASLDYHQETYTISAIQDGRTIQGRFFLGSGTIEGVQVFSYYQNTDGYKTLESSPAAYSRIIECDCVPAVEISWVESGIWSTTPDKETDYIFYVPEGSIVTNYTLDAK